MKIRSDFFPCVPFSRAFAGMKQRPFKADWLHSSTRQCIWLWGPKIKAVSWNQPQLQIMHSWDVQMGLICILMYILSYVVFFFSGGTLEDFFRSLLFQVDNRINTPFCSSHLSPVSRQILLFHRNEQISPFCRQTAGIASDDQFLKSQLLKMLNQWKKPLIFYFFFFFSKGQTFYICCQFSLNFFFFLWLEWEVVWYFKHLISGGTWLRISALTFFT